MKQKLLLILTFSLTLLFLPPATYARESWLSEQISWEIMTKVKSEIDIMLNSIPKKPYFIQNSSTRLTQITTMMDGFSTDCVIRSVGGTEKAVIFYYDTNLSSNQWTKDLPSAKNKIKIPEVCKSKYYSGCCSAQDLRIGVICMDKEFQKQIINLINNIDTDVIIRSNVSRYMEQLERSKKNRKEWEEMHK
jgi:hypothetical protein